MAGAYTAKPAVISVETKPVGWGDWPYNAGEAPLPPGYIPTYTMIITGPSSMSPGEVVSIQTIVYDQDSFPIGNPSPSELRSSSTLGGIIPVQLKIGGVGFYYSINSEFEAVENSWGLSETHQFEVGVEALGSTLVYVAQSEIHGYNILGTLNIDIVLTSPTKSYEHTSGATSLVSGGQWHPWWTWKVSFFIRKFGPISESYPDGEVLYAALWSYGRKYFPDYDIVEVIEDIDIGEHPEELTVERNNFLYTATIDDINAEIEPEESNRWTIQTVISTLTAVPMFPNLSEANGSTVSKLFSDGELIDTLEDTHVGVEWSIGKIRAQNVVSIERYETKITTLQAWTSDFDETTYDIGYLW